mmetsp:Transcript_67679/g.191513  ORF Transcript_67679/g.191513 Transcript_67679/m.191513 type:complete len:250 (-) Transcript_67679:1143-1892(-)
MLALWGAEGRRLDRRLHMSIGSRRQAPLVIVFDWWGQHRDPCHVSNAVDNWHSPFCCGRALFFAMLKIASDRGVVFYAVFRIRFAYDQLRRRVVDCGLEALPTSIGMGSGRAFGLDRRSAQGRTTRTPCCVTVLSDERPGEMHAPSSARKVACCGIADAAAASATAASERTIVRTELCNTAQALIACRIGILSTVIQPDVPVLHAQVDELTSFSAEIATACASGNIIEHLCHGLALKLGDPRSGLGVHF